MLNDQKILVTNSFIPTVSLELEGTVLKIVEEEYEKLNVDIDNLLHSYASGEITKLQLDAQFSRAKVRAGETIMEIHQRIEQTMLGPFQSSSREVVTDAKSWYWNILHVFNDITAYFRDSKSGSQLIVDRPRHMKIWRGPMVDLNSQDGLKFQRTQVETKQLWPTTRPLDAYLEQYANEDLEHILWKYQRSSDEAIFEALRVIQTAEKHALDELRSIGELLETYGDESYIDHSFVL
jgi:hypothetical protein